MVMSGRARLALCAWAATLMSAVALLPLVKETSWILQAAFLLGLLTVVGALTRRVPLARPLTVGSQAMVALLMLTLVFARERALLGFVPGPETFQYFGELLQSGAEDVGRYTTPAPLTDGIKLMLIGGVLVIGLMVDTLAVTFRSAAPAGLPLLALYSVAAGLSDNGAWLSFLVAAAGYLMLLLAEGRERLSQWGRVFGGAPRGPGAPDSGSGAVAPVRTGRRIGMVAMGIALVAPLALPSLDGGLLSGTGSGVGSGTGGGGTISAINPVVSLRDSLNVDQDRVVLTYRTNTDNTQDMYLRIVSLDEFDGTAWKPAQRRIEAVEDELPTPIGLGSDIKRTEILTEISAAKDYAQNWLPMPYPATGVDIDGDWRYEPVGRTLVGDHGEDTRGKRYTVRSLIVQPTAQQLAAAPEAPAALRREFTEVPDSLPQVVYRTARKVTEGAANDYERAVKLQDYFALSGEFTYDTQVQAGSGAAGIARFLRDKEGFCVHFSYAMASMARTLGIPARVAVGFTPGSIQADGTMSVGLRDAHAWPELYFEGVGWTRFEPTPNRGTAPSYTQTEQPGSDGLPDVPRPSQSSSAAPSAEPSESESCTAQQVKLEGCASESAAAAADSGGGGSWSPLMLLLIPGVLAALALPLLPMLWRMRLRSVRLGAHARTPEGAAAHTLAVWQEVTDTAWDYGIAPDDSQTPRKAAARIVRLGELDEPATAAVHRLAAAVEQVLFAPHPRPVAGLAEDARRVAEALGARVGNGTRLRALLAPRSVVRVLWAVSARWRALTSELASRLPTSKLPTFRWPSRQSGG
jgi:transglutaminase-like putative cysteine protease